MFVGYLHIACNIFNSGGKSANPKTFRVVLCKFLLSAKWTESSCLSVALDRPVVRGLRPSSPQVLTVSDLYRSRADPARWLFVERLQQIDRHRKDDGRILLG